MILLCLLNLNFMFFMFSCLRVSVEEEKRKIWLLFNFWNPVYMLNIHNDNCRSGLLKFFNIAASVRDAI